MEQFKLFQKFVILIFLVFISILIFALVFAHSRKSGVTGLSMRHIQEMRINAEKEKNAQR